MVVGGGGLWQWGVLVAGGSWWQFMAPVDGSSGWWMVVVGSGEKTSKNFLAPNELRTSKINMSFYLFFFY